MQIKIIKIKINYQYHFAGLDKTTEGYKWYIEHKLLPDFLKPLASRGLFKNSKVSYGGYNAGEDPEKNLPWILAWKLAEGDEAKAQKNVRTSIYWFPTRIS
ncbi:hypothetical protein [Mesoplasma tabanidae]|uniref:Uncharacterized protein n=1 Tax=Mesoplasma tabanidae TaxID=219745 RepID=A0A2K8P4A9_9MOLU|nr:hypothetical protein [Mesoplasma tabanidae]ATZ21536.1 hypothetical protein MTABA_v1c03330 [Mesoplasma tabanidae]